MRYKMVRVPIDVYEDWSLKKDKIQEKVIKTTKKPQNISMTNVLRFYGKKQTYIYDDELLSFFKKAKRGKKHNGGMV